MEMGGRMAGNIQPMCSNLGHAWHVFLQQQKYNQAFSMFLKYYKMHSGRIENSIVNVSEDTFVGGSSDAGVGYTTSSSY